MYFVLSGPVLVTATDPDPYRVANTYLEPKRYELQTKKGKTFEKDVRKAENTQNASWKNKRRTAVAVRHNLIL
jgi:hypothetical protein